MKPVSLVQQNSSYSFQFSIRAGILMVEFSTCFIFTHDFPKTIFIPYETPTDNASIIVINDDISKVSLK